MAVTVNTTRSVLVNSAAAAILVLPLWAGGTLAQESQAQTQGTEQGQQTQQSSDTGQAAGQATTGQQGQDSGSLIATIGDTEIRNTDVMQAIGALPPQLSAQPPELLVPLALEQLLLREAIVQQARSQGLSDDPQVQSLVEGATQAAEENALVQVWLQRELQNRVTPEAVDAAYAGLRAVAGDQPLPPLEQIRPQIQQSLAQQAMRDIQGSLLSNAQITLYGPDGQPLDQQATTGGQSGDTSGGGQGQSQGNAAGGGATSGEQSGTGEQSSGN